MPRHMTLEQKWSLLIQTITKDNNLEVTKVTEDSVCFAAPNDQNIINLRNMLSDPIKLRNEIIHLLSDNKHGDKTTNHRVIENELASKNPLVVIKDIFNDDFLHDINFKMDSYKLVSDDKTDILEIDLSDMTKSRTEYHEAKFKILQCSITDRQSLMKILNGEKSKIEKDSECQESTFGRELISIESIAKKIWFNFGKVMQLTQASKSYDADSSPIIAASISNKYEYNINKAYFIKYLTSVFDGIVFNEEQDGYVPIMFQPEAQSVSECSINFVLDISGSMTPNFEQYKLNLIDIVKKITTSVLNWKISITAFSDQYHSKTFISTNQNELENVNNFIKNLVTIGDTNLYGAVYNSLNEILKDNSHSTLILLTDGEDNIGAYKPEEVTQKASEARETKPEFAMFTIGIGTNYNSEFFNKIAKQLGFTHIDLKDIGSMNGFNQYIENIDKRKILIEFVDAVKTIMEQVPAGSVVVGNKVSKDTIVKKDGKEYSLGTKVYSALDKFCTSMENSVTSYCKDVVISCPNHFHNIDLTSSDNSIALDYIQFIDIGSTSLLGVCPTNISGFLG